MFFPVDEGKTHNPGVRVSTSETLAMIPFIGLVEGLAGELVDAGPRADGCWSEGRWVLVRG